MLSMCLGGWSHTLLSFISNPWSFGPLFSPNFESSISSTLNLEFFQLWIFHFLNFESFRLWISWALKHPFSTLSGFFHCYFAFRVSKKRTKLPNSSFLSSQFCFFSWFFHLPFYWVFSKNFFGKNERKNRKAKKNR